MGPWPFAEDIWRYCSACQLSSSLWPTPNWFDLNRIKTPRELSPLSAKTYPILSNSASPRKTHGCEHPGSEYSTECHLAWLHNVFCETDPVGACRYLCWSQSSRWGSLTPCPIWPNSDFALKSCNQLVRSCSLEPESWLNNRQSKSFRRVATGHRCRVVFYPSWLQSVQISLLVVETSYPKANALGKYGFLEAKVSEGCPNASFGYEPHQVSVKMVLSREICVEWAV